MPSQNNYDIIVIGLGAMGSAAVYQLAKRGHRVLGIDQFAPPHTLGSTHGESRVTRLAVGEGPEYIPLVQRTHEIWRELEAETGASLLLETGGLILCPTDSGADWHGKGDFVTATAQFAQQFGIAGEIQSAQQVVANHPQLKIQPNFHAFYEPTGGLVNPEAAVRVQLDEARRLGATIRLNERVSTYEATASGVTVETAQGRYSAEKIILATGAWISDMLPDAYREPFGVYRQTMFWFEVEEMAMYSAETFPWVIWIGETLEDYYGVFGIEPDNTPAIKMLTEQLHDRRDLDAINRTVSQAEIDHMAEYFIPRKLYGVTQNCVKADVCLYTITPDEHFVIDWHPESDRVLMASPCSGHGFKHSAAIGEAMAQWVTTGQSDIDLSSFNIGRFAKK